MIPAIHPMVLAAGEDHDVSAGAAVHNRRARVLIDHFLRARWTPWAYVAYDQDLQ